MVANINGTVAEALQQALVNLTDLHLQLKQAHWNIKGHGFRSVHLLLDEIVEIARNGADDVAERLVTLGGVADGLPSTLIKESQLQSLPNGVLTVEYATLKCADQVKATADQLKAVLDPVNEVDPLSADLITGIARDLEKQEWMLQAIYS